MEEEGAWPLPREPQTDLPVAASSMGCLRAMLTLSCTDSTWVPLSCGRRGERTGQQSEGTGGLCWGCWARSGGDRTEERAYGQTLPVCRWGANLPSSQVFLGDPKR